MGKYTSIDDPSAHFQAFTYTGTGSNNSITLNGNSNLQPDLYWYKSRPNTNYHYLVDSSRGTTKYIYPNDNLAEGTVASAYVTSFDTNGVTLGGGDSGTNTNGNSFANWVWRANGGTTASNTDGNTTTTVQANQDAGFSIVTYTGTGSGSQTMGHGLGVTPNIVLTKARSGTSNWSFNGNFGGMTYGTNKLLLNSTNALSSDTNEVTAASSTTFTGGGSNAVNGNNSTYVAYCFAEKQGYSKFGSYVGNGNANGSFIYTGFKPAFVIVKKSSGTGNWLVYDNKRSAYNLNDPYVYANEASAEATSSTSGYDFLSNGFKVRNTYNDGNVSGQTYIYMAFAENPFTTSTGIPTTAR